MRIFPDCGGVTTSDDHLRSVGMKLNKQRKGNNAEYCDLTLLCDGKEFPVHRAVLVAVSDYFEMLLGGTFAESKQNRIDLSESISDPDLLENVLTFAYTGKLCIDGSNFRELLHASTLFLLNEATGILSRYLVNSLVIGNCLEIFVLSMKYSLENISSLCLNMIKSRMHDYFCHGSKMLVVPPEIFVFLCQENVFEHTSKIEATNVTKEYIESIRDGGKFTEVSQETVIKLYEIAKSYGIPDTNTLFKGRIMIDKTKNVHKKGKQQGEQGDNSITDEALVITYVNKHNDIALAAWMNNKWIRLPSVTDVDLGQFVGFSNNSLTFKVDRGKGKGYVTFVPLDQAMGIIEKAKCPCWWCRDSVPKKAPPCPHIYFCAWNTLFCLYPYADIKTWDCNPNDIDDYKCEKVMVDYRIAMYSAQMKEWTSDRSDRSEFYLDIPEEYKFEAPGDTGRGAWWAETPEEVVHVNFKIIDMGSHVIIIMVNSEKNFEVRKKYLTAIKLTQNASGSLESKVVFHRGIQEQMAKFFGRATVASVSGKLIFQKIDLQGNPDNQQDMVELDLQKGKLKKLKSHPSTVFLPKSGYDEYKTENSTLRFATSTLNGQLYVVDNKLPYMNALWSYDPMLEKWRRLPGAPRDEEPDDIGIQRVPAALLPTLKSMPPAVFEDGHDDVRHGPFYGNLFSGGKDGRFQSVPTPSKCPDSNSDIDANLSQSNTDDSDSDSEVDSEASSDSSY